MTEHVLIPNWKEFGGTLDPAMARPASPSGPVDFSQPLKVYWVPGCSACLRMKEFFNKHGVPFVSINALKDKEGFEDLAKLGVKRVPIAARGSQWADGQVLSELARLGGIRLDSAPALPPEELVLRGARILAVAMSLLARIPEEDLNSLLPGRPRTYRQLGAHIFQIVECFLDLVEQGVRLEFLHFLRDVPPSVVTRTDLLQFAGRMRVRFIDWWERDGKTVDLTVTADIYYGHQTLHQFLERSVGHFTHHTRQLQVVVHKLGLPTSDGLREEDLAGLPLPENVYDDKVKLDGIALVSPPIDRTPYGGGAAALSIVPRQKTIAIVRGTRRTTARINDR